MVYVVVVYDIAVERIDKIRTILRRYLFRVQNSVFEGEISEDGLKALQKELKENVKLDYDSIIIYRVTSSKSIKRKVIGTEVENIGFIV